MIYLIKVYGIKQVSTKFERMGAAAVSARPAMEEVADEMMRIFVQIFNSGGRRGGGSWKRDSTEWLRRKQRLGLDPRVLHASLKLRHALTIRDDEHQVLTVTDHNVNLGTDLPYARAINRERPFIRFTPRDKLHMREMVRDYLMAAWRAG